MTEQPTVEVITTVRIGTETKTFTVQSSTTGSPYRAASNCVSSAAGDARDWALDLEHDRTK